MRAARNALLSLAPLTGKDESWKALIIDLRDTDVRGMTVGEEGETEGHRSISWIWKQIGGVSTDDDHMHECKSSPTW